MLPLRYYPPEKQGLRHIVCHSIWFFMFLRYYPPEKQGLRHNSLCAIMPPIGLRYYPPEKQGLRRDKNIFHILYLKFSDTILQKNKD